jgi:uncharacterized protein (DUF1697 family)
MPSDQSFICLIRGVNVGGNKLLKMDALRTLCDAIGVKGAKTYLQSGNVVFRSNVDRGMLTKRIEEGIRKATGFEAKVILRTAGEIRDVIAGNPFVTGPQRNPKALLVAFLGGPVSKDAKALLSKRRSGDLSLSSRGDRRLETIQRSHREKDRRECDGAELEHGQRAAGDGDVEQASLPASDGRPRPAVVSVNNPQSCTSSTAGRGRPTGAGGTPALRRQLLPVLIGRIECQC